MTQPSLAGACALVTGAGSGIGLAISQALATQGARVLLVGRDAERLSAAHAALPGARGDHRAVVGDLTDDLFLGSLAQQTLDWSGGRLAALVLCAGHHQPERIEQTSAASFDAAVATNLRAPFLLTSSLLPALRAARGNVVLVNSSVVLFPRAGTAAYAASKAGLRTFADCLRAEVSGEGVRVLSIFPGRTATPMQRERYQRDGLEYRPERLLQPGEIAAQVLNAITCAAEITELHLRPLYKD